MNYTYETVIGEVIDGDTVEIDMDVDVIDNPDDLTGYGVFLFAKRRLTDLDRILDWQTPAATNVSVVSVTNGIARFKFGPDNYLLVRPVQTVSVLYVNVGLITPTGERKTLKTGMMVFTPSA